MSSSLTEGRLETLGRRLLGSGIELVFKLSFGFDELFSELVSFELTEAFDEVVVLLLEVDVFLLEVDASDVAASLLSGAESGLAKDDVSLSVKTDDTSDLCSGAVVLQDAKQKHSITESISASSFFIFCYLLYTSLRFGLTLL